MASFKFLARFIQPRCSGVRGYFAGVEVVNPFLERTFGHLVETIDFQNVVFRIELADRIGLEGLPLEGGEFEQVVGVDAAELGFAVVHVVLAVTQREVNNVDAVNLAYFGVIVASLNVFRHEFRRAEEHALEVSVLAVVLYFNQKKFAF